MKRILLLLLFGISFAGLASGQVLLNEVFSYSDGNLVGNGSWAVHSGSGTSVQVNSGTISLIHGSGSRQDINHSFASQSSGAIYASFTMSVEDLGAPYSGSDNEYFFHFNASSFRGRVDIVPPSGSGDFSIGIATTSSSADATWASDLTFATTYSIVVRYDFTNDQATLWVDPVNESSTNISGATSGSGNIDAIALRQADSSEDETVIIDDLIVALTFSEAIGLPVELISFSAKASEKNTQLTWQTASEINNSHFEVEHAAANQEFKTIGKIDGAGTIFEIQDYSFTHESPVAGINNYRLKQVDFDGNFEYSNTISTFVKRDDNWNLQPTQSREQIVVNWSEDFSAKAVSVFDLNGKLVFDRKLDFDSEQLQIETSNFPVGTYILKMQTDRTVSSKRFFKIQ